MTDCQIFEVCKKFDIKGEYRSFEIIESGHINTTYQVFYYRNGELKDYILQKINTYVFRNPVEVMENISAVTEYIRAKIKKTQKTAKRNVLHYAKALDGKYYVIMEDGGFWRCCRYIDDSICYETVDDLAVVEEAGIAFGEFQKYLEDYPVKSLHIVIPHFHNTVMRFETLRKAIAENQAGRLESSQELIDGFLELEGLATTLYGLQKAEKIPLRVTHNDTKPSNILFDAKTKKHLSVIDLDTVMPGLVACDFGDAIRVIASTGAEDEEDISKVSLDMDKYEAFARGFVGALKESMTEMEKRTLALGALAMTVECGIRFLSDYLDGDKYFRIHYPNQNFIRARCHLALARDMEKRLDEMQKIVNKYCE